MHFGATVRDIISASWGTDVRQASARTPLPEPRSPDTLQLLAANLEFAFGVAIPDSDLAHFETISDVLQCVRLRRWAWRAARTEAALHDAAQPAAGVASAAAAVVARDPLLPPERVAAPDPVVARDPRQRLIRYTRRDGARSTPPLSGPPSGTASGKRL